MFLPLWFHYFLNTFQRVLPCPHGIFFSCASGVLRSFLCLLSFSLVLFARSNSLWPFSLTSVPFLIPSTWLTWRKKYKDSVYTSFRRRFSRPGSTQSGRPRSLLRASTRPRCSIVTGEDWVPEEVHSRASWLLCNVLCLEHVWRGDMEAGRAGHWRHRAGVGIPECMYSCHTGLSLKFNFF